MKKIIKKTIAFVSMLTLALGLLAVQSFSAVHAVATSVSELIRTDMNTYKSGSNYNGAKIASHIAKEKCASLDIITSGGEHVDGEGDRVFSNYVTFNVSFHYDADSKHIVFKNEKGESVDTNVSIVKDENVRWKSLDKNYRGDDSTENYIKYGVISAVRRNSEGNIEQYYSPVFCTSLNAVSFDQQMFNVDGDYTIYAFFSTKKDGILQRHVISWSFKIRTYVYLIDKTTGFQIKNSGVSGNTVIIDAASRQGVVVNITGAQQRRLDESDLNKSEIEDKPQLSESGTYKFVVENRGFICEVFYFTIDKESVDKKVFFNNLKRFVGKREVDENIIYTYEAEGYFSFTWDEKDGNPVISAVYTYWDYSDKGTPSEENVAYTKDSILDKVGTYKVFVAFKTQTVTYYVNVIPMDNPSTNYGKLSAARFNTFKTKWWEVTDTIRNRVLCFDYETEYGRAYEAAMTIANMSVIEGTGRYYFNGAWYSDRVDLTAAMNDYVFSENLRLVYYDPADYKDDDDSLRTFSAKSFENVIYLNDEFQFVQEHVSEVSKVEAINSDGTVFPLQFFVPMSEQKFEDYGIVGLPDGEYTIVETDKYGNQTRYTAYRDKTAPDISLFTEEGEINLVNGSVYKTSAFSVKSMLDAFDNFAVLKIEMPDGETSYYYQDEFKGITYQTKGRYVVTAYDRNGNSISAIIEVQ